MFVPEPACRVAKCLFVTDQRTLRVDLWTSAVSDWLLPIDHIKEHLLQEELDRADALVFESDRREFIAGRQFLKWILSRYTDIPAKEIRLGFGVAGKPEVQGFLGGFNLSHSGGVATVAVTRARGISLGVDIEAIREIDRDVPKHCFSKTEQKTLHGKSGSGWLESFYRIWTRKEAIIKCFGGGLDDEMRKLETINGRGEAKARAKVRIDGKEKVVELREFAPMPGFMGTVAVGVNSEILNSKYRQRKI
jgi:4'-phosphopantetheinyl transferase